MKKYLLLTIGLLMIFACGKPKTTETVVTKKSVKLQVVKNQILNEVITGNGNFEPVSQAEHTSVAADVIKVNFKNGDRVKAGDVIVVLYDKSIKANYESAKANLMKAESDYNKSKKFSEAEERNSYEGYKASMINAKEALDKAKRGNNSEDIDIGKSNVEKAQKSYEQAKFNYDKYKKLRYPIRVGDKHRERALCFMDAFTKLLRYRGHTIAKDNYQTCVLIDGIYIEFHLREATKRVPPTTEHSFSQYVPTGEFILKVGKYSREKEWRDGKVKLEEILARIIAKLEIYAQEEKKQQEESRLWRLQYDAELERKEKIKKRKEEEIKNFNNLVALSEQYNKALLIRNYIDAEKQHAINTNNLTQEKQEWINWATDKADWLDPLINKPDEILDTK